MTVSAAAQLPSSSVSSTAASTPTASAATGAANGAAAAVAAAERSRLRKVASMSSTANARYNAPPTGASSTGAGGPGGAAIPTDASVQKPASHKGSSCSLSVHIELKSFMLDLTPEAAAIGNRVLSRWVGKENRKRIRLDPRSQDVLIMRKDRNQDVLIGGNSM